MGFNSEFKGLTALLTKTLPFLTSLFLPSQPFPFHHPKAADVADESVADVPL